MSWDVLLQKFPNSATRPEQVPDDYLPPGVGSRAEVASALRKLFRNAESDGESFVTIDRTRFALEISLGDEEPCSQLMLHVHEDHRAATKAILRIADHFGIRAIDCSSGEFIEAGGHRGRSAVSGEDQKEETRSRGISKEQAANPNPPLEYLTGVVTGPCVRCVYMSFLPGESPKRLQNAAFQYWRDLPEEHGELPSISGPTFVLTLPDGEPFGDIWLARFPVLVTETEAEMVPRVQKGALLAHSFAAATGRRSGEVENGSDLVCQDGQRLSVAQCVYRRLWTDADYARKIKPKKG